MPSHPTRGDCWCSAKFTTPLAGPLVDGEEVPLVRVNALLTALEVPAGAHEVQMTFEPEGLGVATGLSRAGSLLWVMLISFCSWMHRKETAA